jgi:hypothetical protein
MVIGWTSTYEAIFLGGQPSVEFQPIRQGICCLSAMQDWLSRAVLDVANKQYRALI